MMFLKRVRVSVKWEVDGMVCNFTLAMQVDSYMAKFDNL